MSFINSLKITFICFLMLFLSCKKDSEVRPVITINEQNSDSNETIHKQITDSNYLIWEITGNGLQTPTFLFGSIHLLPLHLVIFEDKLDSLLSLVDEVVLEIYPNDPEIQKAASQRYYLTDPLQKIYTSEQEKDLQLLCNQLGMPWQQLKNLKPILLQSYLSKFILDKAYSGKTTGYEEILMKKATAKGKKVRGAESVDYAYSYLEKLNINHQVEDLMKLVQLQKTDPKLNIEELVSTYNSHNIALMYKQMAMQLQDRNYIQVMFEGRNIHWLNNIISKENSQLIAVGAAHLYGKSGLINLMSKQGYILKPIKL